MIHLLPIDGAPKSILESLAASLEEVYKVPAVIDETISLPANFPLIDDIYLFPRGWKKDDLCLELRSVDHAGFAPHINVLKMCYLQSKKTEIDWNRS